MTHDINLSCIKSVINEQSGDKGLMVNRDKESQR